MSKTTNRKPTIPAIDQNGDTAGVPDPNSRSAAETTVPAPAPDPMIDRLRQENERLKASIRDAAAHRQITDELARLGARSPELLFHAVKADLQFDPDGSVANAAALLARLRTAFPEQFGIVSPIASIDAAAAYNAPPITRDSIARMTAKEIAALNWEDVKRALAA